MRGNDKGAMTAKYFIYRFLILKFCSLFSLFFLYSFNLEINVIPFQIFLLTVFYSYFDYDIQTKYFE